MKPESFNVCLTHQKRLSPEAKCCERKSDYDPALSCDLRIAFLASDIEELIKGRIEFWEIRNNRDEAPYVLDTLESLLSALESPKDGAEGKD